MFKITDECIGCGGCVINCPVDAITLDERATINKDMCIGCGACTAACPINAVVAD